MQLNGWDARAWAVARALLGVFLAVHFLGLVPWGAELFSDVGLIPDGATSPLLGLFPNVLALSDTPAAVTLLLWVGAASGVTLALGVADRPAALVAWYALTCLLGRNPLIHNPSLPHLGWMLLAIVWIPAAPSLVAVVRDPKQIWRLPESVFTAAWVVAGAAYSYSGWTKLTSASWVDGSALSRILENPLARDTTLRSLALGAPELATTATFGAMGLELLALPLAMFRPARPWLWGGLLLMHLGLLAFVDFTDLTLGMLVTHAFLFDPRWVRRTPTSPTPIEVCAGS